MRKTLRRAVVLGLLAFAAPFAALPLAKPAAAMPEASAPVLPDAVDTPAATPQPVLPAVPETDFWQSICGGVETFDLYAYAPRCLPSNLLTLVRVLSYKVEKTILSKYDAGLWALERLPDRFRPLLRAALRAWYDGEAMSDCPPDELETLRRYLIDRIVDGEPD